jgi:hypothetical protein
MRVLFTAYFNNRLWALYTRVVFPTLAGVFVFAPWSFSYCGEPHFLFLGVSSHEFQTKEKKTNEKQ